MWLFLDMNAYFASVEQQERPELRGQPVGIAPVKAETTYFIAASYEAKCSGVKTGTSVIEARRLCPNIMVVEARPWLYRATHFRIVDAVEKVVPIHEILSVDEMIIKPWKNEVTLADSFRLGQKVQDAIRYDVGEWLSCSIGLAPNHLLAKVASDLQKPRGLSVLSFEDLPHKLYGLKLTDWPGIGIAMARRFDKFGTQTTEAMYQMSMTDMKHVFGGINGERWWRMIRGQQVALPPVKRWQIGHSNVLAPEFRSPEGAWSVASRLLEKAATRLRAEGYLAARLCLSVTGFEGKGWSKRVRFSHTGSTGRLMRLLPGLWQGCESVVPRPAYVSIALQEIIRAEDTTASLFDLPPMVNADVAAVETIDEVVDRLNSRFGSGAVLTAAAMRSRSYLDHGRIPFGKPT